jgi:hypothetical protein
MANAKSKNDDLEKILAHLAALDGKMEEKLAMLNNKLDDGFKEAADSRTKIKQDFVDIAHNIREIGMRLSDKIESYQQEFLKFQHETRAAQQKSEAFQLLAQDYQNDMRNTVQDVSRILARIENNQIMLQESFKQLKAENEEIKKAAAEREATIKKLDQRLTVLEAARN